MRQGIGRTRNPTQNPKRLKKMSYHILRIKMAWYTVLAKLPEPVVLVLSDHSWHFWHR